MRTKQLPPLPPIDGAVQLDLRQPTEAKLFLMWWADSYSILWN